MDDFLGTSIQFAEQQILALEKQHEADVQKTVEDLIASGFLDTDYEDSTDSEYSDAEEVTEQLPFDSDSDCIEIASISTTDLCLSAIDSDYDDYDEDNKNDDNLAMVLYSDLCNASPNTAHSVSDSTNCQIIKSVSHLMDVIVTDIKSLILLFVFMVALPNIMMDHDSNSSVFSGSRYQHDVQHQNVPIERQTSIYWLCDTQSHPQANNDDDERDEYQHMHQIHRVLNFDILSRAMHKNAHADTKMLFSRHSLNVAPCDAIHDDEAPHISHAADLPRFFLHFGAGLQGFKTPQIARIFRDTVSHSVGRQFVRSHHLTALVMSSFVGIAAFAASNSNIDEYLAINSNS